MKRNYFLVVISTAKAAQLELALQMDGIPHIREGQLLFLAEEDPMVLNKFKFLTSLNCQIEIELIKKDQFELAVEDFKERYSQQYNFLKWRTQ